MQKVSEQWPSDEEIVKLLNPKASAKAALANFRLISAELSKRKLTNKYQLGCALATAIIETASTLEPIHEYGDKNYWRKMYWANASTRSALGNKQESDAWEYAGRGFIQLTGRSNYERIGKLLNLPLLTQPDLMLKAEPAAQAFAAFWNGEMLAKTGHTSWAASWATQASEATDPKVRLRCLKNTRICVNGGLSGIEEYLAILHTLGLN